MTVRWLSVEDLIQLVVDLDVGPVHDVGLLQSACARPQTTLIGIDAYPTLASKAAVLMESLVRNHPLADGNKRLGWLAVVVFLGLNGVDVDASDDDAYQLVVDVASGARDYRWAADRLQGWLR